jgi:hypothetical protein
VALQNSHKLVGYEEGSAPNLEGMNGGRFPPPGGPNLGIPYDWDGATWGGWEPTGKKNRGLFDITGGGPNLEGPAAGEAIPGGPNLGGNGKSLGCEIPAVGPTKGGGPDTSVPSNLIVWDPGLKHSVSKGLEETALFDDCTSG